MFGVQGVHESPDRCPLVIELVADPRRGDRGGLIIDHVAGPAADHQAPVVGQVIDHGIEDFPAYRIKRKVDPVGIFFRQHGGDAFNAVIDHPICAQRPDKGGLFSTTADRHDMAIVELCDLHGKVAKATSRSADDHGFAPLQLSGEGQGQPGGDSAGGQGQGLGSGFGNPDEICCRRTIGLAITASEAGCSDCIANGQRSDAKSDRCNHADSQALRTSTSPGPGCGSGRSTIRVAARKLSAKRYCSSAR